MTCSKQPVNITYPELENPVNTLSPYCFKIYLHISLHLPRRLFSSGFQTKFCIHFNPSYVGYMNFPSFRPSKISADGRFKWSHIHTGLRPRGQQSDIYHRGNLKPNMDYLRNLTRQVLHNHQHSMGYWQNNRGTVVRFQALVRNGSVLQRVQFGSMDHPASYSVGRGSSFPGVKRTRREADNALPSSAKVKK